MLYPRQLLLSVTFYWCNMLHPAPYCVASYTRKRCLFCFNCLCQRVAAQQLMLYPRQLLLSVTFYRCNMLHPAPYCVASYTRKRCFFCFNCLCQRVAGIPVFLVMKEAGRLDLSSALALVACWRNRLNITPPCFRSRGCSEGDRHANRSSMLLMGADCKGRQVLHTAARFVADASFRFGCVGMHHLCLRARWWRFGLYARGPLEVGLDCYNCTVSCQPNPVVRESEPSRSSIQKPIAPKHAVFVEGIRIF